MTDEPTGIDGEPDDWPAHWHLQSEHVRGERKFYWIIGMTRREQRVADRLNIDTGDTHKDRTIARGNRILKHLREDER